MALPSPKAGRELHPVEKALAGLSDSDGMQTGFLQSYCDGEAATPVTLKQMW